MKYYFATDILDPAKNVWDYTFHLFTCPSGVRSDSLKSWTLRSFKCQDGSGERVGDPLPEWWAERRYARGLTAFGAVHPVFCEWELSGNSLAMRVRKPSRSRVSRVMRVESEFFDGNESAYCLGTPDKRFFVFLRPSMNVVEVTYDAVLVASLRGRLEVPPGVGPPLVYGDTLHWPGSDRATKDAFSLVTETGWHESSEDLVRAAPFPPSDRPGARETILEGYFISR